MVEGQLRDSTFFNTTRTIKIQTYINGNPPMSDGVDRTEDASRILVWGTPRTTGRGGHMKIASIRTQSVSGWNSRRATNTEMEIGQPKIGYPRRRMDMETAGGIVHGSGPCLRLTEQIVQRSAVTLRRATQTALRR